MAGLALLSAGSFAGDSSLFARSNLVAWCIVPFDAKKRGPEERAAMLEKLGLKHFAYDYRTEHIPTFDAEIEACQKHGISIDAWWFPTELNSEARQILDTLQRHHLRVQLWVMGGGAPVKSTEEQDARVAAEVRRIRPIAEEAAKIGCSVALYNHGNWFGQTTNQIQIIRELGLSNVGIVYNFHHGHDDLDHFAEKFMQMKPYLRALNINGMARDGEKAGKKILPLGQGDWELTLLRFVRNSGWRGPIGILNHTDEDAEARLRDNLDGLDWLIPQMDGAAPGPKPKPRSWTEPAGKPVSQRESSSPSSQTWAAEDASARAALPEFQTIPSPPAAELTPHLGKEIRAGQDWPRSHADAGSSRYSELREIDRQNVAKLKVAWIYHSGDGAGNIQCNPIIVAGVMYAPTVGRAVVAINAETGRELWRFKPDLPRGGLRLEDDPARRGLLFWPGKSGSDARLIFACGNWIYALDPGAGKPVLSFGKAGRAPLSAGGTAIGAIYQNVFVIPGFNRDVFGYDILTGELLWTFHTLPGEGEPGRETWSRVEEGANCWGGMAMDEARGIAYISTGSPKPNFVGVNHAGDDLYSDCVIALDALTGKKLWHFQEIRHDIWDLDIPAPPTLVPINRDGQRYDAVAQVTKLGNTLLLDRLTGRPLFPFRLRRAPVSTLPGERTAAYQPAVELPEPFARQVFSLDDITDRTDEARDYITKRAAGANYGFFQPFDEGKPTILYNIHGGAEWTGAAADPTTGFLYVTANELPWIVTVFRDDPEPPRQPGAPVTRGEELYQQACASCHGPDRIGIGTAPPLRGLRHRLKDEDVLALWKTGRNLMPAAPPMPPEDQKALLDFIFVRDRPASVSAAVPDHPSFTHNGYPKLLDAENYPGCKPPWGTLNCLDLNTGLLRWKAPLGEYPELTAEGIRKTGTENFGGAIVTAGRLVFAAGTRDERIRAFDSETGAELWSSKLPYGGYAPPSTYAVNGKQYVVIAATGGGKLGGPTGDAYVAFALP